MTRDEIEARAHDRNLFREDSLEVLRSEDACRRRWPPRGSARSGDASSAAAAETAYDSFLAHVATPLARQIAGALKAEGYAFTVSTPGRGLRLALDRARTISSSSRSTAEAEPADSHRPDPPHARVAHDRRGAPGQTRRVAESSQRGRSARFLVSALEPWLERYAQLPDC